MVAVVNLLQEEPDYRRKFDEINKNFPLTIKSFHMHYIVLQGLVTSKFNSIKVRVITIFCQKTLAPGQKIQYMVRLTLPGEFNISRKFQ